MTCGSAGSTVRPPLTPVSSQTATRVVQPARFTAVGRRLAARRSRGLTSTPMVMTARAHERGEPDGVAHNLGRPAGADRDTGARQDHDGLPVT